MIVASCNTLRNHKLKFSYTRTSKNPVLLYYSFNCTVNFVFVSQKRKWSWNDLDWGLKAFESAFAYTEVETPAMEVPLFWRGCYLVIKKGRRFKTSTHYSYLKINEWSFTDLYYVEYGVYV